MYLVFPKGFFSITDLFAVRYLWVVCNEDKWCVVTHREAHIAVAWLVYARTYCVPIATLNQNKGTRLLYLGDAQIIMTTASLAQGLFSRIEVSSEKNRIFNQILLVGLVFIQLA